MRKKICMILRRPWEYFLKDLRVIKEAKSLSELYDVSIFIFDYNMQGKREYDKRIEVRIVKLNKNLDIFPLSIPNYFFTTLPRVLWYDADVFHAHDFETLPIAFIAAKMKRKKLVYDSHEYFFEQFHFKEKLLLKITKPFFMFLEGIFSKYADAVITVNESIADELKRIYGLEKVHVIRNVSEIRNVKNKKLFHKEFNLPADKKIVLYHGGIMEHRGIEELIMSMKFLPDNIILVIMGYGPLESKIRKIISKQQLENRVYVKNAVPREKLIDYVSSADIGVIPSQSVGLSLYYSTPNKMYECISGGIPFAASNFPEYRKMAIDDDMGITFDEKNPKSIADAIVKILDPKTYQRKKRNIMKLRKEKYNWEKEKIKLIEIYKEILSD